MTNYGYFPRHRRYGIVIKFDDFKYSWSEDNFNQRKYLIESNYCDNAVEFFVWKNKTTFKSVSEFKKYLQEQNDKQNKPNEKDNNDQSGKKLRSACRCIMCEVSGYPYKATDEERKLAKECKDYLTMVLGRQTKTRKVFDLVFNCTNLPFYGHYLAWNKNDWFKSALIVYYYYKAQSIANIIKEYERIFNEQIVFDYNLLIEYFYKCFSNKTEINYESSPGVRSNFNVVPIQLLEQKQKEFEDLFE